MVGGIILILIGLLISVLGWMVWKRQKINLLHDYHIESVAEENIPAFCRLSGIGIMIVGGGITASGILIIIFEKLIVLSIMALGLIIGISMLVYHQRPSIGR